MRANSAIYESKTVTQRRYSQCCMAKSLFPSGILHGTPIYGVRPRANHYPYLFFKLSNLVPFNRQNSQVWKGLK